MKAICRPVLLICVFWCLLAGCGGNATSKLASPGGGCSGALLKGTLHDSLTFQPVAQAMAILELGSELTATPLYIFSPVQQVSTDVLGTFSLCASSLAYPAVLVLQAMDASGNAYPPYVTQVTAATDLGTIAMGGCTLICGLAGEQQTAAPATITGAITSAPAAASGTVMPNFALPALDGSKASDGSQNLWSLALPLFTTGQSLKFNTITGTCGGIAPYCATYTLTVPTQNPIHPISGGTLQSAGFATYLVEAMLANPATCSPALLPSTSILFATPGAQLTAQPISFVNCH